METPLFIAFATANGAMTGGALLVLDHIRALETMPPSMVLAGVPVTVISGLIASRVWIRSLAMQWIEAPPPLITETYFQIGPEQKRVLRQWQCEGGPVLMRDLKQLDGRAIDTANKNPRA